MNEFHVLAQQMVSEEGFWPSFKNQPIQQYGFHFTVP